ncbi:hypothetical protein [Microbacterium jejuense]|uniref:hypothetical protein n=1 Tax=Microbacterium jejuense TaxID=1263637 RepID=UPI0031EF50D8
MTGVFDPVENTWMPTPDADWRYANIHPESDDCREHGCMIHNPDETWIGNVEQWPYYPRADGRMERICRHGVGHSDVDAARFLNRVRPDLAASVHGCDLIDGVPCCQRKANA